MCSGATSNIQPSRSHAQGSSTAAAPDARARRRSKGPKRPAAARDWERGRGLLPTTCRRLTLPGVLLDTPGLAEEVPLESHTAVLDCGFTRWTISTTLTTKPCAVLLRRLLGVSMVSSAFVTYKDSIPFVNGR